MGKRSISSVVPLIGKDGQAYDRRFIYEWMYDNSDGRGIIIYPQRRVAEILDIHYQHICDIYSDLEYVGFLKRWDRDAFEVVYDPYEDDIWEDFEEIQSAVKKRHQKKYRNDPKIKEQYEQFLEQISGWLPVVATFIPLVVGLLYKSSASSGTKSVLMILITGVATLAQQVIESNEILTQASLNAWILTMVVSVASYYGVWSNIEIGGSNLGNIAPESGVVS